MSGGYRFTPLAAAKANSFVTNDYELVGQYKNDSSIFYLFKSDEKHQYRTVFVNRNYLTFRSNHSTALPYSKDPLQTIGGMSIYDQDKAATVFIVQSFDEAVDSIQIDSGFGMEKKDIHKDEIVHFLLPIAKQIDQLNAIAYDEQGHELYYYGYEKNTINNLKWHKIKDE